MNKTRNVSLSFVSVAVIFLATSQSLKADEYWLIPSGLARVNLFNFNKQKIGNMSYGQIVVKESDFPITAASTEICPTLESDPRCTSDNKVRVVIPKGCYRIFYDPLGRPPYNELYTIAMDCGGKPKGSVKRSSPPLSEKRK